jgi:hypothetical protein
MIKFIVSTIGVFVYEMTYFWEAKKGGEDTKKEEGNIFLYFCIMKNYDIFSSCKNCLYKNT